MALIGHVDRLDGDTCAGWIMDSNDPSRPVTVSLIVNGAKRHTEIANLERTDLAPLYASTRHGFSFGTSNFLADGKNALEVVTEGSQFVFEKGKSTVDRRDLAQFVEIGQNGWLFLQNDSNNVAGTIEGLNPLSPLDIESIVDMLSARYRKLRAMKIRTATYIVPEKGVICNNHRMRPLQVSEDRPAAQLERAISEKTDRIYCYGRELLENNSKPSSYFLKTDTHLSPSGSLLIFRKILEILDISDNLSIREMSLGSFTGDLGNKLVPFAYEDITKLKPEYETLELKDEVTPAVSRNLRLRQTRIYHESSAGNDLVCVLVGTSSAYEMRDYFYARFRKVHFYWDNSVDYDFVEAVNPDFVICVMAERFVSKTWADVKLNIVPL